MRLCQNGNLSMQGTQALQSFLRQLELAFPFLTTPIGEMTNIHDLNVCTMTFCQEPPIKSLLDG
ncbi:hypothetical protein DLJ59_22220 [Micromonospora inaquosa]|uniref:Uncharacterized protein n=1 Tax=Micromonospora inaquosa TaxID=2203716 RepID=A0A3N9WHB5_9ACTN|nr:hypothetical protein DLJ59_22220 [Micromonospora inaquosa]